ncbi:MAG: S-layer homology domain-containing protein [Clostridiales bacterium]|nr:S-layer homology domain-containing protein [Clostridiales bacterium]
MKKHIKLRGLLPIALACIAGIFLMLNIVVGASMPLSASGDPWAGVDFEALLDGDSYIFYGEHQVPLDGSGRNIIWDDLNPVLYRVMGEEVGDGYITLMSDYPVDYQPHTVSDNSHYREHYDDSYIRGWLNTDFLENAFSQGEQKSIVASNVITRAFSWTGGVERTGLIAIEINYSPPETWPVANYPLETNDKIYLPWGKPNIFDRSLAKAYWSSGYADDPVYEFPYQKCFKSGIASLVYTRLRTPLYDNTRIRSNGEYYYGGVGFRAPTLPESIMPIFKLDPKNVIFASPIVTSDPGFHQLLANEAYPAPVTGTAYKLTILDVDLDPATGVVFSGTEAVSIGDTLSVGPSGYLNLGIEITALEADYSIRYKIVGSGNTLLGYGGKADPLVAGVNSFTVDVFDLDGEALDEGTYDVYVWLQKDNETTSFTASTPHYFKVEVGEISDSPPVLSDGTASRSSDSVAVVKFISDMIGTYYYLVLSPTDSAPSAAEIIAEDGMGTAMSIGENTIGLTTLSSGVKKVYMVGKNAEGTAGNVLAITIETYMPPLLPPVLSDGAASRSSDSAAVVEFTSDMIGVYYYQVLSPTDPAPSAADIITAHATGTAMLSGENTIGLTGLSNGEKKIYIVAENAEGTAGNVLAITIEAYIPPLLPPMLSDGAASRSSDSVAMVEFTSDMIGTYYYQVLSPTDPAPSTADIITAHGTGTAMLSGENTIGLTGLSSGEKKIYIVAENAEGTAGNVLAITIEAYTAPSLPPVLSGGTATRSSNSTAVVKFTSDKAGQYFYRILSPTEPAPGEADGTDAVMSVGENTINLSGLSSGEKKIFIVGMDIDFKHSNALVITIGAYISSSGNSTGSNYTVKFETNGGSDIADINLNSGNKVIKPSNPSRSGYIFEGWFIDSGLSKEYDFNKAVTANITLYAKWEEDLPICISDDEVWQKPYINGYPDGTFRANNEITRAEMAVVLYNLMASGKSADMAQLAAFTDINITHWAANAIAWAIAEGYFNGYGDGVLRPDANITKGELAAMLHRVAQKQDMLRGATTTNISFNDVLGHWANNEIMQLAYRGIIQGYNDGSFGPQKHITRAEAVAMVSRLFGRSDQYKTGKSFSDLPAGHWAYTYIMNAANGR